MVQTRFLSWGGYHVYKIGPCGHSRGFKVLYIFAQKPCTQDISFYNSLKPISIEGAIETIGNEINGLINIVESFFK
jgi:hypothetical protein